MPPDYADSQSYAAGDFVLASDEGGDIRHYFIPPSDGSSGNRITFGAKSGQAPVFNGSDVITGWEPEGQADTWEATLASECEQIWVDGTFGDRKTSIANCVNEYDWYWASSVLYLYAPGDPDTEYTEVEAGQRARCFNTNGRDYLIIDGLKFTKSDDIGVFVYNSDYVTVRNCVGEWCWVNNFSLGGAGSPRTDTTVEDCVSRYCGVNGISGSWTSGATVANLIIRRNAVYENGRHQYKASPWDSRHIFTGGIKLWGNHLNSTGVEIYENECYSNGPDTTINSSQKGNGIWIDEINGSVGDLITIKNNHCYDNCASGVFLENSSRNDVYSNLLPSNAQGSAVTTPYAAGGIKLLARQTYDTKSNNLINNTITDCWIGLQVTSYNQSSGLELSDNIFKNNIVSDCDYILRATAGGANTGSWGSGNIYDNNCFGAEFEDFIIWDSTEYDTYNAWEGSHGEAWVQIEEEPSFSDSGSGDYTLANDSPCIGAGAILGSPYNEALMPVSTWPDGVVTGDQDDY
jgi:parallel beta-helix repeat protein